MQGFGLPGSPCLELGGRGVTPTKVGPSLMVMKHLSKLRQKAPQRQGERQGISPCRRWSWQPAHELCGTTPVVLLTGACHRGHQG